MDLKLQEGVVGEAHFSDCENYRYWLTRSWDSSKDSIAWILLNPSTARADVDDPTIRRCTNYSKQWGYGSLVILNTFALRSTDPRQLKEVDDPVGPENDWHIALWAISVSQCMVGWGTHGSYKQRGESVVYMLRRWGVDPYCLGATKHGYPKHPLYLKNSLEPVPFDFKSTVNP